MTDKPVYPSLTDASLVPFRALEAQLDTFPDLLSRPDCPYPNHIKAFLGQMLLEKGAKAPSVDYDDDDLLREISDLYTELKTQNTTLQTTDTKDKVALLKATADLLTRMVSLKERAMNIRDMGRFQRAVLELLEGVLTPAQTSEFIEKMGKYIDLP